MVVALYLQTEKSHQEKLWYSQLVLQIRSRQSCNDHPDQHPHDRALFALPQVYMLRFFGDSVWLIVIPCHFRILPLCFWKSPRQRRCALQFAHQIKLCAKSVWLCANSLGAPLHTSLQTAISKSEIMGVLDAFVTTYNLCVCHGQTSHLSIEKQNSEVPKRRSKKTKLCERVIALTLGISLTHQRSWQLGGPSLHSRSRSFPKRFWNNIFFVMSFSLILCLHAQSTLWNLRSRLQNSILFAWQQCPFDRLISSHDEHPCLHPNIESPWDENENGLPWAQSLRTQLAQAIATCLNTGTALHTKTLLVTHL